MLIVKCKLLNNHKSCEKCKKKFFLWEVFKIFVTFFSKRRYKKDDLKLKFVFKFFILLPHDKCKLFFLLLIECLQLT